MTPWLFHTLGKRENERDHDAVDPKWDKGVCTDKGEQELDAEERDEEGRYETRG